jgi:transcription antitermination factor NusG
MEVATTGHMAVSTFTTAKVRHWFALYTAPNHEKRIEKQLHLRSIESFLPLFTVTRRWKNRTTAKVQLPLFAGYIFVKIEDRERVRVLEIPGALSIVGKAREPMPLPDAEIEGLRAGLQLRQADPYPYLKVGNRVRIRSGALAGWEGIVVRKDDGLRVVLTIDSIMRSMAVHVSADELESCT